jgi:hypothetical protein
MARHTRLQVAGIGGFTVLQGEPPTPFEQSKVPAGVTQDGGAQVSDEPWAHPQAGYKQI